MNFMQARQIGEDMVTPSSTSKPRSGAHLSGSLEADIHASKGYDYHSYRMAKQHSNCRSAIPNYLCASRAELPVKAG